MASVLARNKKTIRRNAAPAIIFTAFMAPLVAQTASRVPWDYESVPITIEVTRDVSVKRCGSEYGVLCAQADFLIRKGERFTMLETGLEGGCTIEYREIRYAPNSCPWLRGFRDHESEIFVIVAVPDNVGPGASTNQTGR